MTTQKDFHNDILDRVAMELDIPPHKYKESIERFDAIKRHLEQGNYPGSTPPPSIYPQGSFRLGTVIRPYKDGRECEFDMDIVCEVNRKKEPDDAVNLKVEVGSEVKAYAESNGMKPPEDTRRCWALNYAPDSESIAFHVDILPCLPDAAAGAQISRVNFGQAATALQYTQTTIAITNRDDGAKPPKHAWRSSNPIGFAKWFTDISQPGAVIENSLLQKTLLFEAYRQRQNFPFRRAEDIPDALVRTPLQRAIQIMKRQRDVRFSGRSDSKHKPISMIITSLAARLYAGKASQLQTTRSVLRYIVDTLAQHTDLVKNQALLEDVGRMQLIRRVGDTWYIPNPVNPHNPGDPVDKGENFADRWHEDNHAKAKAFFQWVTWLRDDIEILLNSSDFTIIKGTLTEAFGESITNRALGGLSTPLTSHILNPGVRGAGALARFNVSHRETPLWPVQNRYRVELSGQLHRNGFRLRDLQNDGDPVPKGCSLVFQANTNAPGRPKVYWQVVNTGRTAESAGDLRGQFIDAQLYRGGLTWDRESTKYSGMHWIECFIVQDGVLVARSGEFIINIE